MRAERALLAGLALAAACAGHVVPPAVPPVPAADRRVSLFLIGDAGSSAPGDAVLAELTAQAKASPQGSVILFLGDNVYLRGLGAPDDPERPEMERRLDAQIDVARQSHRRTIFIPGNHDWARMSASGWDAVRRSETFIHERGVGYAEQLPHRGCPGPDTVDVAGALRLILLDTQWWLQKPGYPKPEDPRSDCAVDSPLEITMRLDSLLRLPGPPVVVAGHHPLATAGEHGGHFPWTTHIFPLRAVKKWLWIPLPVLGSIYPIARANGITSQDLSGGANERLRAALVGSFAAHPPLLYAAGHEHALQVFRGPAARYTVVSGAGIEHHEGEVGWNAETLYAASLPGFMRLDVDGQGRVRLSVTVVEGKGVPPREALGIWLDAH